MEKELHLPIDTNESLHEQKEIEQKEIDRKGMNEMKDPKNPLFSPEQQQKIDQLKKKLEVFTEKIREKFDRYVVSVALIPPPRNAAGPREKINLLVVVNDGDRKKLSRWELKKKVAEIVTSLAKDIDPSLDTETALLSELWNNCCYGNYEILEALKNTAIIYDRSLLHAIKFAQAHKQLALRKFENYILSYVLHGVVAQGEASEDAEIQLTIVIDDTDVRKMSEKELREKLGLILSSMSFDVREMLQIKNRAKITTILLSEFWQGVKDSNPATSQLLRTGVPLYDRSVFTPWKNLLQKGKLLPSPEAVSVQMQAGKDALTQARMKVSESIEALSEACRCASHAALMQAGQIINDDVDLIEQLNTSFVKNKNLLEKEYLHILRMLREARHSLTAKGTRQDHHQELSGKELDHLQKESEHFVVRMERLLKRLEHDKQEHILQDLCKRALTASRSALLSSGVRIKNGEKDDEKATETALLAAIKEQLIVPGKLHPKHLETLQHIVSLQKQFQKSSMNSNSSGELSSVLDAFEIHVPQVQELIADLITFSEITQTVQRERQKLKIKHGGITGELFFAEDAIYLIEDLERRGDSVKEIKIYRDGSLGEEKKISWDEYLLKTQRGPGIVNTSVKEKTFRDLKALFQGDLEIFL